MSEQFTMTPEAREAQWSVDRWCDLFGDDAFSAWLLLGGQLHRMARAELDPWGNRQIDERRRAQKQQERARHQSDAPRRRGRYV